VGESFLPALRGQPWQREQPVLWEHEGNCAVRDGRWKLVRKYPGEWELYDMVEDRTELNDLSAKDKPRVARMAAVHEEWAERCGVLPWEQVLDRIRERRRKR
jgi:arylsulfatase